MNRMTIKFLALLMAISATVAYGMTINGELKKAQFEKLSSDPISSTARVYYNTTSNKTRVYDGSSWSDIGGATSSLNQFLMEVGDSSNARATFDSSKLGDVSVSATTSTVTVTIAAPGVMTYTSHGLATGDRIYFSTTGALPTGLTVLTTYYIIKINANSFNLATSYNNAIANTKITTTGSQSGTHTAYTGGLRFNSSNFRANTIVIGDGDGTSGQSSGHVTGANAAGTNIAGVNLYMDAPNGTGTGGSGPLVFRTAPAGSTGTTPNTLDNAMVIDADGLVTMGRPATATNHRAHGSLVVGRSDNAVGGLTLTRNGSTIGSISTTNSVVTFSGDNVATSHGSIDSSGMWTVGRAAGGQTHDINGGVNFNTTESTVPQTGIRRNATNELSFSVLGLDTIRIKADQSVEIGHTNGSPLAELDVRSTGTTQGGLFVQNINNANVEDVGRFAYQKTNANRVGTENFLKFTTGTGTIGSVSWNATTTVAYNTSSDRRLKENIESMKEGTGLAMVMEMTPVEFDWKEDKSHSNGFIAQDLKKVYPYAVSGDETRDAQWNPMSVDYGRVTPVLVQAIKDLKAEFEAYKLAHP